jgi:putative tryptophan/tyrosine transport system substrate-binding protein
MRRREFIAGLTGAAAWSLAARAQRRQVVGLLNGVSFEGPYADAVTSIRHGLEETGLAEGQDFAFEYRAADGEYERLADLAADLVRSQVAVIVVIGAWAPALADRAAALSIPIVFAMASDAVEVGVANGFDRPQVGLQGATLVSTGPVSERFASLLELRPGASLVGYLDNSRLPGVFETNVENVTAAARMRGRELAVFDAGTEQEVRALMISPDPFLVARQEQIIALAAQSRLPTVYPARGAVVAGGLMSYGLVRNDMYRAAGIYAGRILKGAISAELPIMLPTRFELVLNHRTAMALRITVPRRLLARADEIID